MVSGIRTLGSLMFGKTVDVTELSLTSLLLPPEPHPLAQLTVIRDTCDGGKSVIPNYFVNSSNYTSRKSRFFNIHLPERPGDPTPTHRNLDPLQHPFAQASEPIRALNAAKMERMFSKPFITALEGHSNAVEALSRRPNSITDIASRILSCGVDRNIKMWNVRQEAPSNSSEPGPSQPKPHVVFPGKGTLLSIDHHSMDPMFATSSTLVQIWDETKSASVMDITFSTSAESVTRVRFNPSEPSVLASISSDRTLSFMTLEPSPTFPTNILLASEDHNLYTFDIRRLSTPTQIYKAHVSAVTSCDWSPTGTEFVSGGWDRTLRIWQEGRGTHPEVYYTKRMQRVLATAFTADARFVLSGSDGGNVRVWKADASEKLGVITARERSAIEYRNALKERWKMDFEIGKLDILTSLKNRFRMSLLPVFVPRFNMLLVIPIQENTVTVNALWERLKIDLDKENIGYRQLSLVSLPGPIDIEPEETLTERVQSCANDLRRIGHGEKVSMHSSWLTPDAVQLILHIEPGKH
ncbi:WD40-repeat-containing domain protein [Multifurca ochricompacta]|uniref:DDB1- and CUL4-associated factor 13 n=1 Tax=Multifurca ochricompacta TaxID=376703 RepID=A0AAD4M9H9_9AGAM|nr:WD40-repeat-containing domain protein [Multifurca ochricompacta]